MNGCGIKLCEGPNKNGFLEKQFMAFIREHEEASIVSEKN